MVMVTKRDRMETNLEGLLPVKSQDPLITWSCNITWQTKTITSPLPVPTITKLTRIVTNLEGLLPIMFLDLLVMWSCKITWQTKTIISLRTGCLMTTKLGIGVTCYEGVQSIKVTWPFDHIFFHDHMTKLKTSRLTECLWPPNLAEW